MTGEIDREVEAPTEEAARIVFGARVMVPSGTRSEPGPLVLGVVTQEKDGEWWVSYVHAKGQFSGGYYQPHEIDVIDDDDERSKQWRQTPSK